MNSNMMTLLTWHDGSDPAPEGTIALLLIQDYEFYDFQDYLEQGLIMHFYPQKITAFGISEGHGKWLINRVDPCKMISEGDFVPHDESGKIIRWAELPFETTEDNYEELTGEEAEEAIRELRSIPLDSNGTRKYIKGDM